VFKVCQFIKKKTLNAERLIIIQVNVTIQDKGGNICKDLVSCIVSVP
jgi:hypothetical protein